jgi:hypothetical protein
MSDNGTAASTLTLEELASEFRGETERLRAENARLSQRLAHVEGRGPTEPGPTSFSHASTDPECDDSAGRSEYEGAESSAGISRRRLLKRVVGAGALGAGILVVGDTFAPRAAWATTGTMMFGQSNDAGNAYTDLTSSNPTQTLSVENTGTGPAIVGDAGSDGAGVWGTSSGSGPGVYGSTQGTGYAVEGQILSITETPNSAAAIYGATIGSGPGVQGSDGGAGTGPGVYGQITNSGNSAAAISGSTNGTGYAIEGQITNSSSSVAAVYGQTNGIGGAVLGKIDNPSSDASAVNGVTNGNGSGIYGYSTGVGSAVSGEIQNASSSVAALYGQTNGTGQGVFGYTTGTGSAIKGTIQNTSSSAAAVYGTTSGSGPGVQGLSTSGYGGLFSGSLAPISLTPAGAAGIPGVGTGSHAIGDIWVDENGLVFVCTGASTGSGNTETPGTWRQLAMAAPTYYDNPALSGIAGLAGSVNLLSSPIRVFDSRVADSPGAPSRAAGVLAPGSAVTVQVAGTTVGSIEVPVGAVGVIGNVTAFSPTGNGKLVVYPTGGSVPSVTNLNYQSSDSAIGNLCIVPLGSGSDAGQMNIEISSGSPGSANVAFDVFGFVF